MMKEVTYAAQDVTGIDYSRLPAGLQDGVKRYIEKGDHVGGFLTAVLCNNLKESFARADETNQAHMFGIVSWFYNEAPGQCWGSPEKMKAWMAQQRG